MTSYKIVFKEEVEEDLKKFDKSQKILIFKQIKKLLTSPHLGKLLGNIAGYDLTGYRKMYVDKKKIRIVYKIIEDEIVVEVIAVAKRGDMEVYKIAGKRV